MTCDEFSGRISDDLEGVLSEHERVLMDRHAMACAACAESREAVLRLTEQMVRLPRVRPSAGFDFALRSRLLLESAEKSTWKRRAQGLLFPSFPRALVSGAAAALLVFGVVTAFQGQSAQKTAESAPVELTVVVPAVSPSSEQYRGALRRLSQEASYPISRQFYRSQADSAKRPAPVQQPVRQASEVRRVSVRF
ncbi:MAG: zf-HC2 domain-containing protein [bacterium]|nr:zf-HC2 domain-containing protein [bacterium]